MAVIGIRTISPRHPVVRRFIEELDAYQISLYPPESNHLDSIEELEKEHVHFVGAFEKGRLLGCGAVKTTGEDYGELKRVYVAPDSRRRGIGGLIVASLERFLLGRGIHLARLETGIRQPEAIALYESRGYGRIGPFGDYRHDPLGVYMEKRLHVPARSKALAASRR